MRLVKMIALALVGIFAMTSVQAATFVTPSSKTNVASAIEQVAAKKDAKKAKKPAKKSKKKGKASKAGKCGTNMYWHKKDKKCADARNKK